MSAIPEQPQRPSRKGKERDQSSFAESFQDKMIAIKRRNAGTTRPREKLPTSLLQHLPQSSPPRPDASPVPQSSSRARPLPHSPPSPRKLHPSPQPPHRASPADADPEEFSRRLRISSPPNTRPSPTHRHATPSNTRLYNPDTDPIPMHRTAEPEAISDTASSSYAPRSRPNGAAPSATPPQHSRDGTHRQLFDHRKDDPVRFSVLTRPHGRPTPTPKSSGDYVSASSTSSYAPSAVSSSFTLSSDTTGGSSASSALFDRQSKPEHESGSNKFALQLKKLYRTITTLETKIKSDEADDNNEDNNTRIMLQGKEMPGEDIEKEKWRKQIADHKQFAEVMHNLLEISLAPSVPASLRNIPTKYKIVVRLWSYGFHKLLESLRRASLTSPLALEHLQDFIYYAYTYYTGLYEERILSDFKNSWLEALGDLARYQMIVATMVQSSVGHSTQLTAAAVSKVPTAKEDESSAQEDTHSDSDIRLGDQDPSVGVAAARLLEVEPEKERWRNIAKGWYSKGIADTPGAGKLHHHLGLLSREELRAVYHFVKSMTTIHPFPTSRETVLPIFSGASQARRSLADSRVPDLFVLLHGMLFTNIQLDDFQPTLARFLERLTIEGAEEREWIMMAVINVGAVLEYGKPGGVLKRAGAVGGKEAPGVAPNVRVMAKSREERDKDQMDIDDERDPSIPTGHISPPSSDAETDAQTPLSFTLALQLTFATLSHVLRHPLRREMPNPYLTVLFTFLAAILKHDKALEAMERTIPWAELAQFFARIPRQIMKNQRLDQPSSGGDRWAMVTSGCAPPLAEDWCLRGMDWIGRKVFERGYWKNDEDRQPELEILDSMEIVDDNDVRIEDDTVDESIPGEDRWTRIIRCAVGIAGTVAGFTWVEGTREWRVEGVLAEKVQRWEELDRMEREEEEKRLTGRRWDDSMDIDDEPTFEESSDDDDGDENDSEEVKALKARRKYLQSLIQASHEQATMSPRRHPRSKGARKAASSRPSLRIVPGYTVLVLDTNILLSSLSLIGPIIESLRWTVVIPLPVITELDGLTSNHSELGQAARDALEYVTSHIRTHSVSLKVQTSKGNYLTTLNVRTEQIDFTDHLTGSNTERTMDDLILKAAIWQDDHWTDRSAILKVPAPADTADKVVLITLDRNLRLKARSRSLPAANEKELAAIFANAGP